MTLDLSLPLCTRSGLPVKIVTVLPPECALEDDARIVGLIDWGEPGEPVYQVETWQTDGTYHVGSASDRLDLINAPVSVTVKRIREVV